MHLSITGNVGLQNEETHHYNCSRKENALPVLHSLDQARTFLR